MIIVEIIVTIAVILAVLYLLAIMPHMTKRPDLTPFQGRYYAHRGLHDNTTDAPENTLAAFKKAVDAGYGIELDIQLTRDRVPVVVHDFHLKRVAGADVRVDSLTLEELQRDYTIYNSQEHVPTLESVLKLVDGKVPLIVEFKIEGNDLGICEVAAPMLDQYQGVWCMESFNPFGVEWYRKNRPQVMRGQLSCRYLVKGEPLPGNMPKIVYWLLQNLMLNFKTKPDFIAFDHGCADMLSFRLNKKLYGITTVAWTLKNQAQLEAAEKWFDLMIFDSFVPRK